MTQKTQQTATNGNKYNIWEKLSKSPVVSFITVAAEKVEPETYVRFHASSDL